MPAAAAHALQGRAFRESVPGGQVLVADVPAGDGPGVAPQVGHVAVPPLSGLDDGQDRRAGVRWQRVPGVNHLGQLGVEWSVSGWQRTIEPSL